MIPPVVTMVGAVSQETDLWGFIDAERRLNHPSNEPLLMGPGWLIPPSRIESTLDRAPFNRFPPSLDPGLGV